MTGLRLLLKLHHDPHPWDDLWRAIAVEHPVRDAWWDERNLIRLLDRIEIPVYLGCDWQNVPLHLPGTLAAINALPNSPHVRVAMLGEHGVSWPWESLHVEALAWYDQWLKGRDTGILDGPRIRYVLPGARGWRTAQSWPVAGTEPRELALRADGTLGAGEGDPGHRTYMTLGAGLNRARPSQADPPASLTWASEPLPADLDVIGNLELRLDATSSAADTAWIVLVQDISPDGASEDITAGYLRASLREVDQARSQPGAPALSCRSARAVPINEPAHYRVPLVGNARRFRAGHRVQLVLTSDDQDHATPAMLGFRHASVGTSSLNQIASSSRLILPVSPQPDDPGR